MNANTDKTLNSPSDAHQDALFYEALSLFSNATPEKQAAVLGLLRKKPKNQRAYLPKSISDLVENDIRDVAFELVAITKAILMWSTEQDVLPIEGGILDMDIGDMVTLSDMAIRRAQRIVDLANEFESSVTYLEGQA